MIRFDLLRNKLNTPKGTIANETYARCRYLRLFAFTCEYSRCYCLTLCTDLLLDLEHPTDYSSQIKRIFHSIISLFTLRLWFGPNHTHTHTRWIHVNAFNQIRICAYTRATPHVRYGITHHQIKKWKTAKKRVATAQQCEQHTVISRWALAEIGVSLVMRSSTPFFVRKAEFATANKAARPWHSDKIVKQVDKPFLH